MPTYSHVISLPRSFDESAIDTFVGSLQEIGAAGRVIIDASKNLWVDPSALVTLYAAGAWLHERGLPIPRLLLPVNKDARSYWVRLGATRYAHDYFDLHGTLPDLRLAEPGSLIALARLPAETGASKGGPLLLDLPDRILNVVRDLGLSPSNSLGLVVAIGDVAAELLGEPASVVWICAQVYTWRRKLGRRVLLLALASHAFRPPADNQREPRDLPSDRRDIMALETLLIRGISRFRAPDDSAGAFAALRRSIGRVDGRVTLRAGSARLSIAPSWEDDEPVVSGLPPFTGTLVTIALPEPLERQA